MLKTFVVSFLFLFAGSVFAADKLIQVNGIAETSLEPNMISMNVEVWSKSANAKTAQQLAAQEFKNVKKVFDDFKVKKEDIQTDNYSLQPEYQWDPKTQQNKALGFRVVQTLNITLRSVEGAGPFLDALIDHKQGKSAGMNVNSIRWDSDQRAQAEITALGEAVKSAKAKADELAKAAGVKIKSVSKLQHSSATIQPPMPLHGGMAKTMMAEAAAPTELAGGQIKVRVEVQAEYEF